MNPRTITVQAPLVIPKSGLVKGGAFLHVVYTDSAFRFRWVPLRESPIYIHPKTGEKRRLTTSLTSKMSKLPKHGKVVLTFEEMLVGDDGKIYNTWEPSEWFRYEQE